MKNITRTIASIGLSLVAIGAMAQTPDFNQIRGIKPLHSKGLTPRRSASVDRVMSGPQSYVLNYPLGDQTITLALNPSAQFADGYSNLFILDINNALSVADSGSPSMENMSANNVTCAFDTVWDANTMNYVTNIASGSVTVDSILVYVHYHNTSGKNDTVILSIDAVDASGYPAATVYGVDTAVITPTFFAYNKIDSVQGFYVKKPIAIPAAARHGWNFCVQMTVHAPKAQDTIGLVWNMQVANTCTALGGYYVNEPTAIGVPNGAVHSVNTFANGYWWFNTRGRYGNNTSLSWPLTSGPNQGYYSNFGGYYWAPLPCALLACCGSCTGDTIQWNVQDVYIIPYITATSVLGVNNITASDFSIGQNVPNPFNQNTVINYSLNKSGNVVFTVYDMAGRELVNNAYSTVAPGKHSIELAANQFTPGVYFYTFNVNGVKVTKRMVITE